MSFCSVQVVQRLCRGGIESKILNLQRFCNEPRSSYIIVLEGERELILTSQPELRAISDRLVFINKYPGFNWSIVCMLTNIFNQLQPDVVHTHQLEPLLYGGIGAKRARVKTIVHTEHNVGHLTQFKTRNLQRILLKMVDPIVVADSYQIVNDLFSRINFCQSEMIYSGIDTEHFKPGNRLMAKRQFNVPEDVVLIGCTAQLSASNDHFTLLHAMLHMPTHVHLVVAGLGELELSLKAFKWDKNLSHRVHFLGQIRDMSAFYRCLDVFCVPSTNRGVPVSALEAQATGIPVVASDRCGVKEAMCPDSGRLFSTGNATDLAYQLMAAIVELEREGRLPGNFNFELLPDVSNNCVTRFQPDAFCTIGQMARNFVVNNKDVKTMVNSYNDIYMGRLPQK
jgi:glycosyltransferase involved in cell wall biosynthesis